MHTIAVDASITIAKLAAMVAPIAPGEPLQIVAPDKHVARWLTWFGYQAGIDEPVIVRRTWRAITLSTRKAMPHAS